MLKRIINSRARPGYGILVIVLAMTLAAGNVLLGGHLSIHDNAVSENCALCMHAAGASHIIPPAAVVIPVTRRSTCSSHLKATPLIPCFTLHDHPSRAPPSLV